MAKARKILTRLNAVRNVRTVTVAMETIARSRFKKTHDHAIAVRPYTTSLSQLTDNLLHRCQPRDRQHPLLDERPDQNSDALLVLTADRGLCGGYNSAVLAMASERYQQLTAAGHKVSLRVVGKKGIQYFRYRKHVIDAAYTDFGAMPDFDEVVKVVEELLAEFLDGTISNLEVVYMQFVSSGVQNAAIAPILPLAQIAPGALRSNDDSLARGSNEYEFIPSPRLILARLLPATVRLRIYQCFLDAAVGEQIARITAMRGANDNANDMIKELNRSYNRVRQSQITTELAEILGGRAGLE